MKSRKLFLFALLIFSLACAETDDISDPNESLYFPPLLSAFWEPVSPETLGWNHERIPALIDYLNNTSTRAFIVLKNGKIVIEHYHGSTLLGAPFGVNSNWYWASAGKTLTAFTVGIAQQEGHLDISQPTSQYLGAGWTSLESTQEQEITIYHQLSMTSGLNDQTVSLDCTLPECLTYQAAPEVRWSYHNAPYTLLQKVTASATGTTFDLYFDQQLKSKIGMDGFWQQVNFNSVYFSTARSMARFGLLVLNNGYWDEAPILSDQTYFNQMISPSQSLNQAYGYLWWLNGQPSYMVPTLQTVFSGKMASNAPDDLVAGIGRDGQLLHVIPSQGLVIVRMGEAPESGLVPFNYQNELWGYLKEILPQGN